MPVAPTGLTLDEVLDLLHVGAHVPLGPGAGVSQLDHALQTAALLAATHPGDAELVAAGLVHDIGHVLSGVNDDGHARAGADAIRAALGERVAALVGLHVAAKRLLVATDPTYGDVLAPDSAASLERQGGILDATEATAFRAGPLAGAALALRQADDGAKDERVRVVGLRHWVPLLRMLSDEDGRAGA